MRFDLGLYSCLLGVALGSAYWASLPAPNNDTDKVPVATIEPKSIAEITYTSHETRVRVSHEGERYWVTDEAQTPQKSGVKAADERFLASEKIQDVVNAFHPFEALRVVGKVGEQQLDDYGLKQPEAVLTIRAGQEPFTLKIGKHSYGSANRYVQDGRDGRVLLVDGEPFATLEHARIRLFEHSLSQFTMDDAQEAEVKVGDKVKTLSHTTRDGNGILQWGDAKTGSVEHAASYRSWLERLARLRVMAYPSADESQQLTQVNPELEVSFLRAGKPLETLTVKSLPEIPGQPLEPGKRYFIHSDFLHTYARVSASRLEAITKDTSDIMGE